MSVPEGYEEVPGSSLVPDDVVLMKNGAHWMVLHISRDGKQIEWDTPLDGTRITPLPATVKRRLRRKPVDFTVGPSSDPRPGQAVGADVRVRPEGAITVQEYLARYGVTGEALRGISGQFGKRVAGGFRARYGDEYAPDQVWEHVEFLGRDHLSNCYLPVDQDLLDLVREKFYPQLRPVEQVRKVAEAPSTVDMFDDLDAPTGDRELLNALPPADIGPDGMPGWSEHDEDIITAREDRAMLAAEMTAGPEVLTGDGTGEPLPEITLDNGVVIGEQEAAAGLALAAAGITSEPIPPSEHHPEIKHEKPKWLVQWEMSRCRAAGVPCGHELCREYEARRARTATRKPVDDGYTTEADAQTWGRL